MARKVTVIPANPTGGSKAAVGGKRTRVAAYCRVSTDHEDQEGSFKNQVNYYTKPRHPTPPSRRTQDKIQKLGDCAAVSSSADLRGTEATGGTKHVSS